MTKLFETRHDGDYIAKLRENTETNVCTEIVFYKGEQIYRADFSAAFLGDAKRGGYLEKMAASIARKHRLGQL